MSLRNGKPYTINTTVIGINRSSTLFVLFSIQDPRFLENGVVEVLFSRIVYRNPSFASAQPHEGTHGLSDSGLSCFSHWTGGLVSGLQVSYSSEEQPQLKKTIPGIRMEEEKPSLCISRRDPIAANSADAVFDNSCHLNGETVFIERETDIIDDDDDDDDDDIPTHKDATAALSDTKETLYSREMSGLPSLRGEQRCQNSVLSDVGRGVNSSNALTHTQVSTGYQTHIWVKQLESVSPSSYTHTPSDRQEQREEMELRKAASKPLLPDNSFPGVQSETEQDDEFAILALDIDQSIEQLNQIILDLDPEFVPIPTQARGQMTRSASLHTNGMMYSGGRSKAHQSGWRQQQLSDVSEYSVLLSAGSDLTQNIQNFAIGTPSQQSLYYTYSYFDDLTPEVDSPLWAGLNQVPPTPAFPVSPPTLFVKCVNDFIPSTMDSQTNRHYMTFPTWQESRGYVDSMMLTSMSSDGQKMFGSMHSISTPSPLVNTGSPTPSHSWLEGGSSTPLSHYTPQPSPPLTLSSPNSHSPPQGAPRSLMSLDVGGLESSLLEAVEELEALCLDVAQPPLIPLKRRGTDGPETMLSSPFSRGGISGSFVSHNSSPTRSTPSPDFLASKPENVKFVQDTTKFWYKPDISREQAIGILNDKEPGSFIIRDSHSFRGAYGLAMKVATPPPSVLQQSRKKGDLSNELVRHFLIECTPKGVRLKGCPNEPYFGSLTALVCQHSITSLALPCRLIIPSRDPLEELNESQTQSSTNSAAELLKQGAACNVWFLGSVELESLTGVQGVQKATTVIFSMDPPPTSTIVHFKVSAQGITLTDNQRKLFFRRHYAINTVIFCALDPQDRKWMRDGCTAAKIFGFIARKSGSSTENVCHLFAEHDPEQPASAIVNFVSKVMIGSQKK
ncbi:tensin-4-like [Xyrauchen texanus]|uniref:tensin-4-like n=1 Tax=Xyrauchen texanus TaxID=154827 RepID=UPI00224187DF|nr:tensin-4-like [Xyrauchen texanus]